MHDQSIQQNKGIILLLLAMIMLVDGINGSIYFPLLPELISLAISTEKYSVISLYSAILSVIYALGQLIFSPLIGRLSDRIGRRPLLIVALVILLIQSLMIILSNQFSVILMARLSGGIATSNQALIFTIISDLSSEKERISLFARFNGVLGLGFVLGPMISAWLASVTLKTPLWLLCGMISITLIACLWLLPETQTQSNTKQQSAKIHTELSDPSSSKVTKEPVHRYLITLITCYALIQVIFTVYPSLWVIFVAEQFQWSLSTTGFTLSLWGFCFILAQVFIAPWLSQRVKADRLVIVFLSINCISTFIFVTQPIPWIAMIIMPSVNAFGWIAVPCLQHIINLNVKKQDRGLIQGILNACYALALLVSPLLYNASFYFATYNPSSFYFPALPFLISALVNAFVIVLFPGQKKQ